MFLVRDLGESGAFARRIAKLRCPGGRLVPRCKTWRLDGSTRFGVGSLYRFGGVKMLRFGGKELAPAAWFCRPCQFLL